MVPKSYCTLRTPLRRVAAVALDEVVDGTAGRGRARRVAVLDREVEARRSR